ncbi:hypothetical protein DOTSEDRAFT_69047 [Lecanosticta acicola]|uniref:P-loop containing nucleoside triphosphate hydrolase protein n=1 Tax=Lecanosticta acicola TaxID=111012 RepID=A0AAI8Z0A8_9PEZI|nr:hypothetical protein DOTSEDRAFT_69047 [Lecanosticta acicola]
MRSQSARSSCSWTWVVAAPLLSAILLLANQLVQAPEAGSLKPKVFVLGLSKTGTTSIGDALELLGYRRLGWRDIRSRHMVHSFVNGDQTPLVELTRYYDAFEDLPWPFLYREMAELHPDAKFVLSLRKDEETWMRSMKAHVGRGRWLPYTHFYGADTYEGNEEIIRQSYRNHTQNVRNYFEDKPRRYVELSIDDGDVNWDVLCLVAQCPTGKVPSLAFPKSNTAASWDVGWLFSSLQWLWGWTLTRLEEQTTSYYYSSGHTTLKPLLSLCWWILDFVDRAHTELYFRIWPAQPRITVADTLGASTV